MNQTIFSTIVEVVSDLQQGKMIILVDDESRENEGDLVMAADFISSDHINFMIRKAGGFICLAMTEEKFDQLEIPMMVKQNRSHQQTPFGVSIEAAQGVTTGVSATDRAHTIRVASQSNATVEDIVMPGHVATLCANPGGVLARAGHTEGSVDLLKIAKMTPAAVICEVMNEDGSMARLPDLIEFAKKYGLKIANIHDLISYRVSHETLIKEISNAKMPTRKLGQFHIHVFRDLINHAEHIALVHPSNASIKPALVRMHSECLTGDVLGSARCDCGQQLEVSLEKISEQGGVFLYLRQEGRGIGLGNKIKAYQLQERGLDTVEANHHLGFPADQRDYGIAAQILNALGIQQVRLLTNNPHKIKNLERYGVSIIERVPLETKPTNDNIHYLKTKREKLGHLLESL